MTKNLPPSNCGKCNNAPDCADKNQYNDTNLGAKLCTRSKLTYHISEYCRNNACVYGFIDWFDDKENLITTTVCTVCKPDTVDYLKMFPNVGERTHTVLQAMTAYRSNKMNRKNDF